MIIVDIKKLTTSYGKSRGIVDISMQIEKGDTFGFIGPNGAGKSTAIRTLLGFLFPTSGEATIFGLDCIKHSKEIKGRLGYIPSEINYYDDMKVKGLLDYSAQFYQIDSRKRINELCDIFQLDVQKKINSLSLGNKKKVAIVQALLHNPDLLILDEPTSGLDPLMQKQFFDVLRQEQSKGTTIFFSSHILSEVQQICSKVAFIKEGRILDINGIEELTQKTYLKIKVTSDDAISVDLSEIPGVMNVNIDNNQAQFMYIGNINILIERLSHFNLSTLLIEEPALEEIFMHYYKGGKDHDNIPA